MRLAMIAMLGLLGCGEPEVARSDDAPSVPPDRHHAGPIELEVRSEYSQLRVRKRGRVRTLLFVDDSGRERVQSRIDLAHPARLELPYTKMMLASDLLVPAPRRALLVGLGGGALVHALRDRHPELEIDAVEIDRAVIDVAAKLFDVRDGGRVHIHHRDAVAWLADDGARYDVIYLDAFLGDDPANDATGAPRALRTRKFFERVRARLVPGEGVAVINLHHHIDHEADLAVLRSVFAQVYTFLVPGDGNVIAIGAVEPERRDQQALRARAAELVK